MNEANANQEISTEPEGILDQFRLIRIQTFNWGTFSGVFNFPVSEVGFLFVGPSGSGKSTVLDAHAALLTPPRWVDFNVAAREAERHGKDRSVVTYLRGAWAQQTGDDGEYASQYLRPDTTWSAIVETYHNRNRKYVVLAQLLWIRGKSTATSDVKRLYLILEREFEIRELDFFPKSEFEVRKIRSALPDAFVKDEFSGYQERFRRLLGIDNELALRLLHKTQSAKNLGDLNIFLRDFMLDTPQTFEIADRLVLEFGELNAAHQAVVAARQQIETLLPARSEFEILVQKRQAMSALDDLRQCSEFYREQYRRDLLQARLNELHVEIDGARQEEKRLTEIEAQEFLKLRELQDRRYGMGGGFIEQLQKQLEECERDKSDRLHKRDKAAVACRGMSWSLPNGPTTFAHLTETARQRVLKAADLSENLEGRKDDLKNQQREKEDEFRQVRREIEAMERQRSNIPSRMLDVRHALAAATGIAEEKLPFAGELLEVHQNEGQWQGSIERVLHGLALSLLVDEKYYAAVSSYLNDRNIGERLVYLRTLPRPAIQKSLSSNSLPRKVNVAPGSYHEWLRDELRARFDYECAETIHAFRNASRAITQQGQVKHGPSQHEKDDRFRVDDRSRWVLGFDNRSKLDLYKTRAFDLAGSLEALRKKLEDAKAEEAGQREQLLHCQTLANLTWADIDVAAILKKIADLHERIATETSARPDLAKVGQEIESQTTVYNNAVAAKNSAAGAVRSKTDDIERYSKRLESLSEQHLSTSLNSTQRECLDERLQRIGKAVTLESLDLVVSYVEKALASEKETLIRETGNLRHSIEGQFAEFIRTWPTEGGGLDATLESANDFFAKLRRLETDGLPRFEERFLTLLREQSDQNLTLLSARLDHERKGILDRLELVNDSLKTAEFNKGTHLVIETLDRSLEEVRLFKASLKEALSHSFSEEPAMAEGRFVVLSTLVKKIASQETIDKNWRSLVLDVRQHVEFVAKELDSDDREVEIYRSGAGKSGGQRQKLAATCLAAALRYQLGGQDRALPSFSTVVLDEAFDKADAEFTATAMNIFKTFGFQMIVATPLKSVMTLEPFIGGACFIHIRDRKDSSALMIEYDTEKQRLKLPAHVHDSQQVTLP
ncbi:MAG: ATP-binding protein [Ktedonobacter sp. 13_2_20CM_53_11]|nr:MAG: ATP-binding protein [Ktedonobacter sp. 13_2_20CM_53_11]